MTVYKLIDLVGTSGTSLDDAIRGAIQRAGSSVEDLRWFEVRDIRGRIDEDNNLEYQVQVQIGFSVHAPRETARTREKAATRTKAAASERTGTRKTRSPAAELVARKGGRKRGQIVRGVRER